jgi:hypothetical protein
MMHAVSLGRRPHREPHPSHCVRQLSEATERWVL